MSSRTGRGGGRSGGRSCLLFLIFTLSILTSAANAQSEFGYGPKFDACGDNCQTQLLHFCTELRDAQQQQDCWCGVGDLNGQYVSKMDACLATCDPKVSDTQVQRDMILRYRNVVCRGDASEDPEFKAYYWIRYGEDFTPEATRAAALPAAPRTTTTLRGSPIVLIIPSASTTSVSETITRKITVPKTTRTKKAPTSTSTKSASSKSATTTLTKSTPKLAPTPTTPTSTSSRYNVTPTHSSPHETSTLGASTNAPSSEPKTLSAAQITGISVASLASFVSILVAAACIYRVRNRKRDSKANYIWSPITPVSKQSRLTPDSLGNHTASTGGIKSSLARWLGWKPEPPELDIHAQYASGGDGVPTIRVQSPSGGIRKVGVSPPMMANSVGLVPVMHGAHLEEQPGLEVVIPDSGPPQVYAGSAYPAYPTITPIHPYQPHPHNSHDDIVSPLDRREIILPPVPHAVTTPSGYYNAPPPRPFSEATGFTEFTSDTEMSQSEWTDYGDQSDSANRRRLDQLLEEVDLGYRGTYAEMDGDGATGRPGTSGTQNTSGTGQPRLHGNLGYF